MPENHSRPQTPVSRKLEGRHTAAAFLLAVSGTVLLSVGYAAGTNSSARDVPNPLALKIDQTFSDSTISAADVREVHANEFMDVMHNYGIDCGGRKECLASVVRVCTYLSDGKPLSDLLRPDSKARLERMPQLEDNAAEEFVAASVGIYCVEHYDEFKQATR